MTVGDPVSTSQKKHSVSVAKAKRLMLYREARPTLGPTRPPIQLVPGALSQEIKRQGREADHSPPSSDEVRKRGAIPPLPHMSS
jgi:hypothetical protein